MSASSVLQLKIHIQSRRNEEVRDRINEEIPFAKSLVNGYLVMLDCSTRRSIIRTLAHVKKNDLKKYTNKRWTVRHSGTQCYIVRSNTGRIRYIVRNRKNAWLGTSGFRIYKEEKK